MVQQIMQTVVPFILQFMNQLNDQKIIQLVNQSNKYSTLKLLQQSSIFMLYHRHSSTPQTQSTKRKTKEGDWTCLNCFNYNYSFRQYCNRCRSQQRQENQRLMNTIGKENYGENSFPSVLFLQYPQRYDKQNPCQPLPINQKVLYVQKSPCFTQTHKQKDLCDDIDAILNENVWISNLIGE